MTAFRVLLVIASVFVLMCLGILPYDPVFALVSGWGPFIGRTFTEASINRDALLSAAICLAAVLILGHVLAGWLWRETARPGRWRIRWTLAAVGVVVLMFVSGLAVTGLAHQVVWLVRSDQPWLHHRSRYIQHRIKCAHNLRQIGVAISHYTRQFDGRWPDDFAALLLTQNLSAEVLTCSSSVEEPAPGVAPAEQAGNLDGHVSYTYYAHGWTGDVPAERVVASEPLFNHDNDGVNILFADGHVEWHDADSAGALLPGTTTRPTAAATHQTARTFHATTSNAPAQ